VIARRFLIEGRVQGVGYRFHVVRAAADRGIRGWVRNLPDGRVEIFAEGEVRELDTFREEVRRGPGHALVRSLNEIEETPDGRFAGFDVVY
jgi:acylphosphatase